MSDKHTEHNDEGFSAETAMPLKPNLASARRHMLKKGITVAPVVLTLISRPVLAWHCKSPSAWGSEQLDPKTSLRTNEGHKSWADETWTITNWTNNSSRAGLGKPWVILAPNFGNPTDPEYYKHVTVKDFFMKVSGLTSPSGLNGDAKVVRVLGSNSFQAYVIVAQLNFLLLAGRTDIDKCLTLQDLQAMATGVYSPPNLESTSWGRYQIKKYLIQNWIVRP